MQASVFYLSAKQKPKFLKSLFCSSVKPFSTGIMHKLGEVHCLVPNFAFVGGVISLNLAASYFKIFSISQKASNFANLSDIF